MVQAISNYAYLVQPKKEKALINIFFQNFENLNVRNISYFRH